MKTLIWGNTFLRAYRRIIRKRPDQTQNIEKTLRILAQDPFNPVLETHKLKGKLSGSWACSVGYDLRIIFDFVRDENEEESIFLMEIGTHDEVY